MSSDFLKEKQYCFLVPVWRTTQQQEIDLIEDNGEGLLAYEFKWNANSKVRFPQTFTDNYSDTKTFVISPENIEDFLLI